ncbi:uncharacterized protein Z518_00087 [Rhinocladiella mackenziei CBS 650.93]|uniref:Rhinocladiella mackenziei CBS 650.93 unplaced genomic scaffold supercont1.1, whole genome shotgun sequence n=1 Tax=Rhinocladiella mackenziei CBS 650.93 TaxID=1442369 RepID=A0A0D2IST4_9EURO|nr:uncharacterized protein Z518_00087 [Rhinocladiella mackenziei CBS 650.93]KIX09009.1 hypothetical protein Z518_00087 [Rhinocladiella mackenziei CBS 650.93]
MRSEGARQVAARSDSPSAMFARGIRHSGSSAITFEDSILIRALPHLADDYILGSDDFRNDDGSFNDNPDAGLRLFLEDFANGALTEKFHTPKDSTFISAESFHRYLNDAEERASFVKQRRGMVDPRMVPLTKRRRSSTPPEDLDQTREQAFQDEEERAAKRHEQDDLSCRASSTSEPDSS